MSTTKRKIATFLKRKRIENTSLTQVQVAKLIGVASATYGKLEIADRHLRAEVLLKLSKILKFTLDEFAREVE